MVTDVVPFLANIALVAHADGTLSAAELGQLETIRKELKFKKSDYNAAIRLVADGDHKLTPVGSFADQVKNLELMLRVAYADSDLDKSEVSLILDFCKSIGIKQDQLNRLRNEVLSTLKQQNKVCPGCGLESDSESRFCPGCGIAFDSSTHDVQLQFTIPKTGIAIEFAQSTSAAYPKALAIAKSLNGYQTCQKGKTKWNLAVYPSGQISEVLPLAESLTGLRNRSVYIDGKERSWEKIFGFSWCSAERANAYRPAEYCFGKYENRINPWGCKQARMDWAGWAEWFRYGKWEKSGLRGKKTQWKFDKERIKHELASNLYRFRFCPYLKTSLSSAVLKYFPETVNPETDPNWAFHEIYEEVPGAIKVVQKERSDGISYTNKFWSDGVRPKGHRVLDEILTYAFQDLSVTSTSVEALLK
ncbi:conserved hypothetical protein [delta proteobacterium NaphS2]|nr:conserved hypothetical protein [delta proteobacterium NaphS2]